MEIIKVEGIIVGETNYSESSKILKIFTKDYGMISVMSKGCRNLKSKLRGISTKMVYADFQIYYKENGISTLVSADIIDTLRNILVDINRISYLSYILDLTEQVYKASLSLELYPILIATIKKINEGYDYEILTYIYELKLLDYLGIRPNVDGCSICGSSTNILTISTTNGGYICQNCYHGGKIYAGKTIQLIRMFIYLDINQINKLDLKEETKKEIEEFITNYYDEYSGLYLKSRNFLKNLTKISNC
jgi:DNA repair protein RecO (recombination protein O)